MYSKNIEEVESLLKTSKNGLSFNEVEKRLKQNGKNEIPKPPSKTIFDIFINQFKSTIVLILIIAAVFSIITKSYSDSIFIFLVITINAVIGTFQEWSSEKNAEKLQNMIKIKVKVLRDGKKQEVESENIVFRRCCFTRVRR